MSQSSIVIVGGGYAGAELARNLDEFLDVTLVEPKRAFVHAPAMLRSLVDPHVLQDALVPYDKLLKHGHILSDLATEVDGSGVTLKSGNRLNADFIVIATGSSNGIAFKPDGGDLESFLQSQKMLAEDINQAKSIAIVGAGAVGTELAGEIAYATPDKTVTLISSESTLFPSMPQKLGRNLEKKLKEMGVHVKLGLRSENLQSLTEHYSGTLTLTNGEKVSADIIIPAIGSKPDASLLTALPGAKMGIGNRVAVDPYLRPSDLENVFALGDAVDAGDAMTIVAISRQQPWLAKTLKALAKGKKLSSQKKYSPWDKAPFLVPLGPRRGNSYLQIATFGDWVTRAMKGRDLFVPKYRKMLGY